MSDVQTIKDALRQRVEELAAYLYPNGKPVSGNWCVGDVTGVPGKSFKICLTGDKAGLWGDFAGGEPHSRSLLDLWMQSRKVDFETALQEAAQWLGYSALAKSAEASTANGAEQLIAVEEGEVARDDFPHSPDEAAFHGLAGDIVRRLEPHTEASSVAILIQVLTTFGSAIGRNAQ